MQSQNEIQKYISGVNQSQSHSLSPVLRRSNYGWWFILILFLSFLGINIFGYLAWGTEYMKRMFAPLMGGTISTLGETVNVSTQGVRGVVDIVDKGLSTSENIAQTVRDESLGGSTYNQQDVIDNNKNSLNDAININRNDVIENDNYKPSNAKEWCYVGEYNGIRTCRQLGEGGTCMSGNIFPSKDVCINPKLRQNN